MRCSRRALLKAGGTLTFAAASCWAVGAAPSKDPARGEGAPQRVALRNLHTNERVDLEYYREGAYVPAALAAIEVLLRDFRSGERHAVDPHLMDYLVQVAQVLGVDPAFSVISGYRSPATNAQLREKSAGVAQRSLHMEGRAIDVRVKGVDCARLAASAETLKRGGVGYYRASDFVHLDTGAFRTWKG